METIKWENANALEIGMLMEMAEDGYVFCTTNDMYQQSMSIGYMIDDMHSMITGAPDSGMKYLFKLNRKINSTKR